MKFACSKCHNYYDEEKQNSFCPHNEFPKSCKLHNRKHCGNPECLNPKADIREINRKERIG